MLLKVALPDRKAPKAPTKGATSGQAEPTTSAALAARAIGMLARPPLLTPEWMKMRTIGTAAPSATALPRSAAAVSRTAASPCPALMPCKGMVTSAMAMNMVPGRYSGATETPMSVPSMPVQEIDTACNQSFSGKSGTRVATSRPASIRYGAQARPSDIPREIASRAG